MAGALRFAIEFLRINERVLGPLSVAHIAAVLVVAVGVAILRRSASRTERPAPGTRHRAPGTNRRVF
jgi:prolipoprotein diacylglyceryltransferase